MLQFCFCMIHVVIQILSPDKTTSRLLQLYLFYFSGIIPYFILLHNNFEFKFSYLLFCFCFCFALLLLYTNNKHNITKDVNMISNRDRYCVVSEFISSMVVDVDAVVLVPVLVPPPVLLILVSYSR